jgi:hypothetical protein
MQHVHNVIESLHRQRYAHTPPRVTIVQPSLWERLRTKMDQTLSQERVAAAVFGTVTVLLTVGLFVGLARALAHYTIIPLP